MASKNAPAVPRRRYADFCNKIPSIADVHYSPWRLVEPRVPHRTHLSKPTRLTGFRGHPRPPDDGVRAPIGSNDCQTKTLCSVLLSRIAQLDQRTAPADMSAAGWKRTIVLEAV